MVRRGGGAAARRARVAVPAAPAARRGAARGAAGRHRTGAGAPAPDERTAGAPRSTTRARSVAWSPGAGRGGRHFSACGCSGSWLPAAITRFVVPLRLTLCQTRYASRRRRRQALARGRIARARLAATHTAASTLAAVVRGWLARRRVHDELVAPAVLAAGGTAKARLQAAR